MRSEHTVDSILLGALLGARLRSSLGLLHKTLAIILTSTIVGGLCCGLALLGRNLLRFLGLLAASLAASRCDSCFVLTQGSVRHGLERRQLSLLLGIVGGVGCLPVCNLEAWVSNSAMWNEISQCLHSCRSKATMSPYA